MTAQGNRVLHILLVTALALAGCDSKDSSSVTQDTGLAIGQAEYVGSGQCADCHAKAWQQWQALTISWLWRSLPKPLCLVTLLMLNCCMVSIAVYLKLPIAPSLLLPQTVRKDPGSKSAAGALYIRCGAVAAVSCGCGRWSAAGAAHGLGQSHNAGAERFGPIKAVGIILMPRQTP